MHTWGRGIARHDIDITIIFRIMRRGGRRGSCKVPYHCVWSLRVCCEGVTVCWIRSWLLISPTSSTIQWMRPPSRITMVSGGIGVNDWRFSIWSQCSVVCVIMKRTVSLLALPLHQWSHVVICVVCVVAFVRFPLCLTDIKRHLLEGKYNDRPAQLYQ